MTSPDGDELLRRAARALREEADLDPGDGVPAWRSMHRWPALSGDVRRAARRRRLALVVGLQLVALAGVGAWAAVSGRLPALFPRRAPATKEEAPASARRSRPARSTPSPPTRTETPLPAEIVAVPAAAAAPPPRPARLIAATRSPRLGTVPLAAEPVAQPPAGPEPEELYRQAHRAHFVVRDYAAALALWDAYLAAGGGPLAPEARYNRAIALAHLGRREAAVAALAPFAAGADDGYRQEDAQALLRKLGATPP
jgi:hypothetical protein